MQSTAVHCAPEQLCVAVEQCARTAAKGTLAAFGAAATRCAEVLQRQQQAADTAVSRN
jgi:hypothetical protein